MKNYLLLFAFLLLQLACSDHKTQAGAANATTEEPLPAVTTSRISAETDYFKTFQTLKTNLDSIKSAQKRIYAKAKDQVEFASQHVTAVNFDVNHLNALLLENKTLIQQLNASLTSKMADNKALADSVAGLNRRLVENQGEIMDLNDMLYGASEDFRAIEAELYMVILQKAELTSQMNKNTEMINEAHYLIGTFSQLKEQKVINSEGGVLGIGKRPVLNSDLNPETFTKIDQRKKKVIPLNCKRAKLLSLHSTKAYQFEKDKNKVKQLVIVDPEEFWRVSKYLVILTEN